MSLSVGAEFDVVANCIIWLTWHSINVNNPFIANLPHVGRMAALKKRWMAVIVVVGNFHAVLHCDFLLVSFSIEKRVFAIEAEKAFLGGNVVEWLALNSIDHHIFAFAVRRPVRPALAVRTEIHCPYGYRLERGTLYTVYNDAVLVAFLRGVAQIGRAHV